MGINLDKPHLWNNDTAASVDLFNTWFLSSAPKAYRETRIKATESVENAIQTTNDFREITVEVLRNHPAILPTLRMACCPPLAVDRLIGLAKIARPNLVKKGLEVGRIPARVSPAVLAVELGKIVAIVTRLLDRDIFAWLATNETPTDAIRHRGATIVADRLCGSIANRIIKNALQKWQLASIEDYLTKKGYVKVTNPAGQPLTAMKPGTFGFHVALGTVSGANESDDSVDVVIHPGERRPNPRPILVKVKSAGDFTNANTRCMEEAKKIVKSRAMFGQDVTYLLFLWGYFNSAYLGCQAAEGIDWLWAHRIGDFDQLGI